MCVGGDRGIVWENVGHVRVGRVGLGGGRQWVRSGEAWVEKQDLGNLDLDGVAIKFPSSAALHLPPSTSLPPLPPTDPSPPHTPPSSPSSPSLIQPPLLAFPRLWSYCLSLPILSFFSFSTTDKNSPRGNASKRIAIVFSFYFTALKTVIDHICFRLPHSYVCMEYIWLRGYFTSVW